MRTLRRGDAGSDVHQLQIALDGLEFNVGPLDGIFGPATESAVLGFQAQEKILVDGIVGPVTWRLIADRTAAAGQDPVSTSTTAIWALPPCGPHTAVDRRFSLALQLMQACDDGQGFRYCGWSNPYLFDKAPFKSGALGFPFPSGSLSSVRPGSGLHAPLHGGTCSPWAGWFLAWWLCANGDYNFRVGRSAWNIVRFQHDHQVNATTVPGFAAYCESDGCGMRKASLSSLYEQWAWLRQINVIPMEHHVILVVKVGGKDGLCIEDPRNPGAPCPAGLYRFGADGSYPVVDGKKYYSGVRQTWRRLGEYESVGQKWDLYRVQNLDPVTGSPVSGPFAGRDPWDLSFEA
jgi:hypothetical protein